MLMNSVKFLIYILLFVFASPSLSGTFRIDADKLSVGTNVMSRSCEIDGTNAFTTAALKTFVTDEVVYSGMHSLKLTIPKGGKGFGGFGGMIHFNKCFEDTPKIYAGDEVWVRFRIFVPEEFEFNLVGRNKFLRFRAFHMEGDKKIGEGHNDLYLDARNLDTISSTPYDFIFEGEQRWYKFGSPNQFLAKGKWHTVEYYLRLGHKSEANGGAATVRFWVDGVLLADIDNRITLKTPESFVESFNFFTYWNNEGAHKTQSLYVDDFLLTTDIPQDFDEKGNVMLGLGEGFTLPKPIKQCPVPG